MYIISHAEGGESESLTDLIMLSESVSDIKDEIINKLSYQQVTEVTKVLYDYRKNCVGTGKKSRFDHQATKMKTALIYLPCLLSVPATFCIGR